MTLHTPSKKTSLPPSGIPRKKYSTMSSEKTTVTPPSAPTKSLHFHYPIPSCHTHTHAMLSIAFRKNFLPPTAYAHSVRKTHTSKKPTKEILHAETKPITTAHPGITCSDPSLPPICARIIQLKHVQRLKKKYSPASPTCCRNTASAPSAKSTTAPTPIPFAAASAKHGASQNSYARMRN